jgi:GT2 family glycosyltransferase
MNVLVSLVNYNSHEPILNCLKDIFAQQTEHKFKVVVFDNNSPDKSADEIKKEFPKIHLVKHEKNLGFGKAHNLVAKQIVANEIGDFDAMLLVNPDTRFGEHTFDQLFKFLEDQKKVGIVSGKIVKSDGSLDSNGGNFPFGLSLISWLFNLESFGLKSNFHRSDKSYYETSREVDWVGGTFMLIRREVIETIGLFDDDYFMYFEDVDFCIRVKKAGFSIKINPKVAIMHLSGASSENPRYFQWSNEYKNLLLFYKKNVGGLSGLLVKMLVYISIVLRIVTFGILCRFKIASTYWKVLKSI